MSNLKTKYLMIGTSAAGLTAALELRKLDPGSQITCLTGESEQPYNKCFLVDYLAGERALDTVYLYTPEFLAQQQIEILYNSLVVEIRPNSQEIKSQEIQLASGELIAYDKLLIATGARAWTPPISGLDKLLAQELALNFYSLQDTLKLMAKLDSQLDFMTDARDNYISGQLVPAQEPGELVKTITNNYIKHVTIIGAGLTGLECADALWRRGLKVTIIDQSSQILNRVLDQDSAQFLQQKIINSGVNLILDTQVLAVAQAGDNFADTNNSNSEVFGARKNSLDGAKSSFNAVKNFSNIKIKLSSQAEISTDLILLATGVQANSIKIVGEQLNLIKQQIQVSQFFATNLPNIWAAGDAILVQDLVTGELRANRTWPDAILQGRLAARSMFADKLSESKISVSEMGINLVPYTGQLAYYKSHMFNLDLVVCGNLNNLDNLSNTNKNKHNISELAETSQVASNSENNNINWASYNYNLAQQLQGFVLLGDISQGAKLRRRVGI